jgi:hypothetical protein
MPAARLRSYRLGDRAELLVQHLLAGLAFYHTCAAAGGCRFRFPLQPNRPHERPSPFACRTLFHGSSEEQRSAKD